jgi:SAM-dependent methyltransferase
MSRSSTRVLSSYPCLGQTERVNENHKLCGSDEWRAVVRDSILPWALGDVDLGDDVLEVGPGYGATTDVLAESVPKLTAVEIDAELARMLRDRFAANGAVTIVKGDATDLEFPDGRFSGAASFTMLHHVPTAAFQDRLFADVAEVLRPRGIFILGDSLASEELEAHHQGDTYNPVDPAGLTERLKLAGFAQAEVKTNPFGWAGTSPNLLGVRHRSTDKDDVAGPGEFRFAVRTARVSAAPVQQAGMRPQVSW